MLAFVTSLRAKALAHDWAHHVRLLERTLASFLAQTDEHICVIVVCHERPVLSVCDSRVQFIEVDLPLPRREFNDLIVDKVLKISVGARRAIDDGCRFLMYADADDLVSRRLASFARAHPEANGWYFPKGYSHRYGQPWLKRSHLQYMLCGTCAIVRTDLLRFEYSAENRGGWVNTLAAAGHQEYHSLLAAQGHPLAPLPFAGSVYIQHADSVVTTLPPATLSGRGWREVLRPVRATVRELATLRPLTRELAREFTIERAAP